MVTAGTAVKGSAGYVAIERVSGTRRGHSGTFVLQHMGTITQGVPQLSLTVVPDSGTGELIGLTGRMNSIIADGKHSYEFGYALPQYAIRTAVLPAITTTTFDGCLLPTRPPNFCFRLM